MAIARAPSWCRDGIERRGWNVLLARARHGKGAVLIATNGFESPDDRKQFYHSLDGAIGQRTASCANDAFELAIRSGNSGRYLCVLNPDTRGSGKTRYLLQEITAAARTWES